MGEVTLRIDGMHCGSCVRRVSRALASSPGIEVKEVRVGAARFVANDESGAVDQAVAALDRVGFKAHVDTAHVNSGS